MKVISWKKSELKDNLIVAKVKCSACGKISSTTCESLSELHHCVCSKCGHIDVEYKDGRMYKDSAKLVKDKNINNNGLVVRKGIERMTRTFNKLEREGKVDSEAFEDKESFVKWSIEHGYRDWKSLKLGEGKDKLDRSAAWSVSAYGTKEFCNKQSMCDEQGKVRLAKGLGVYVESVKEATGRAKEIYDTESNKWNSIKGNENIDIIMSELDMISNILVRIEDMLEDEFE